MRICTIQLHRVLTVCSEFSNPSASINVSLTSLNSLFNDLVVVEYFLLYVLPLFHRKGAPTRYPACAICDNLSLSTSILDFESVYLSPFWPLSKLQGKNEFVKDASSSMLEDLNIGFRPFPPCRHSKNVLESNHDLIRSIFIRLRAPTYDLYPYISEISEIRMSNVCTAHTSYQFLKWRMVLHAQFLNPYMQCCKERSKQCFNSLPSETCQIYCATRALRIFR